VRNGTEDAEVGGSIFIGDRTKPSYYRKHVTHKSKYPMSNSSLEKRVTRLEAELANLKVQKPSTPVEITGWQSIVGVFADNSDFEEAVAIRTPSISPSARKGNSCDQSPLDRLE
jgi:hypothetical protein